MKTIQSMINQVCEVWKVCPKMADILSQFYFGEALSVPEYEVLPLALGS